MSIENDARRSRRALVSASVALACATGVGDGFAQQGAALVEEIVVTARRVEEKLNEVPVAVTAYTGDDLKRRNVVSLADIAALTPGFSFEAYSGGTTPAPLIRGLSQAALTDRNQNVGTFVDGVHVQQQGNVDFTLMELERIEIIKGPQNAQYGRSSFAGAINWVPRRAELGEWGGNAAITYGTDERQDISAAINIPIGDVLAVRVYGIKTEFDGTFKNNFPGSGAAIPSEAFGARFSGNEGNVGGWDNDAVQVGLKYQPVEDLQVNLLYYRSQTRNEPGAGLVISPITLAQLPTATPAQQNPLNCSPTTTGINQLYCGELPVSESEVISDPRNTGAQTHSELVSARIDYKFSDSLGLMYLYGRGLYDSANYQAAAQPALLVTGNAQLGGVLQFVSNPFTDQEAESHELRLDGQLGRATWRLGYYYSDVNDFGAAAWFTNRRPLRLDPTNAFVSSGVPAGPNSLLSNFIDRIESPFATVTIPFADTWTVDLEARYTQEERRQILNTGVRFQADFDDFTPRVNVRWKPREEWTLYASAARGAKSGGFNGATADIPTFEPEQNTTFELGAKQTLWGRRLQLNYAVFATDWTDLQLSVPDTIPSGLVPPGTQEGNFIGNVKGADALGVELEAQAALTDRITARFAGSYVESTFKDGTIDTTFGRNCETRGTPVCVFLPRQPGFLPLGGSPIGGNDLPRTPRTQLALSLDYWRPLGKLEWTIRGDLTHQSKYYAETLNLAWIPSRTLLNLDVGLRHPDGTWSVNLWGNNVTDEVFASSAFAVAVARQYTPALGLGAMFGLTARYNFVGGN
ncbi:MAG: TonB-dependent receptor [Steroidobacteraceae bacterium]|jgi:iron complex outermembrane receptor protein|nr:TonB-dependent receptor [Steroidobacteraceae bacterium]